MHTSSPGIRLFIDAPLDEGQRFDLDGGQAHYLRNVMRLSPGAEITVFNGTDGEFSASIEQLAKKGGAARCLEQLREQEIEPDLWLVFSPIKKDSQDFLVEKAVELGVSGLWPISAERTNMSRVNAERLRINATEAAEQCERLSIPQIFDMSPLHRALATWPKDRYLLVANERGDATPIAEALTEMVDKPIAVLIGPEGGFTVSELDGLAKLPFVRMVQLGPRILRAETAAVSALACAQAWAGDWRKPRS